MSETVIVTPSEEVPATQGEVIEGEVAVAQAEATEAVAEAAVEIAEIEANRDVEIAEINAEARVEEAEAFAETLDNSEELAECRRRIEALETENLALQEQVTLLTPPPLIVEEETPPNPSNPESGEVAPQEVEEAAPEPKAPSPRRKLRWI